MNRLLTAAIVLGVLFVSACTQFSLVEAQKPARLGNAFEFDPQIAWSKTSSGPRELWTVDGPLLNALHLYGGLLEGDPLFEDRVSKPDPKPLFRKAMSPLEIRDFIVASLTLAKLQNVSTADLRPFDFAGNPGFRFEFAYVTEDGLRKKGFMVGAVYDDRLYLISYGAPEVFYYEKHRATVDRMVASLRRTGKGA